MKRITAYDSELKPYAILITKGDDGAPRLKTEDGREVKRVERGEYDIVDSKSTIRVLSDDPAGP